MFSPHLLFFIHASTLFTLLPPCSLLFPLFSFILEYLSVAINLVWICFLLFHLHSPEFLISCQFLKIPRKYSFLKNSRFFFKKKLCPKWGREAPGTPQGDPPCHHTTWWRGQGQTTPWHGVGPLALHLPLHQLLPSLTQNISTP
jgi:hypothetical protein